MTQNKPNRVEHPPFLYSSKRFATIGLHPALDKSGSQRKKITDAGPGSYDPKLPACSFKKGYLWKVKVESENFSKYRGHRNSHLLEKDRFQKTLRGPGTNDINESLFQKHDVSAFRNVTFGKSGRFVDKQSNSPSPDTYWRKFKDLSTVKKKSFSTTSTFEFDGFVDRFKLNLPNYLLPSNIYNFMKHDLKNTADITRKVVSTRSPYDMFTGPRNDTTIKGYFAVRNFKPPENFYVNPSDLDVLLEHHSKSRTGKFFKERRFPKIPTLRHMMNDTSLCYRKPTDPGPAHYRVEHYGSIQQKPVALHPFNTSQAIAKPSPATWNIFPGPGRYTPKLPKCMKQKRPSWVFLTKQTRGFYVSPEYMAF